MDGWMVGDGTVRGVIRHMALDYGLVILMSYIVYQGWRL